MDQNNLFTEEIPSAPLVVAPQKHDHHKDFDQDELSVIAPKNRRSFLILISVLVLFVMVNVGYFLYRPDAFASVIISIFFINVTILAWLCYLKKTEK